jgi:GAF domain-containing protein
VTSRPAEELAEVLVELADMMSVELDLDGFLRLLVNRSVQVLDVPAAGVLIVDHGVVASHDRLTPVLGHEQNPLTDCVRAGAPVTLLDLATGNGWPAFTEGVRDAGFASVHVLPLGRRGETLGALALFHDGVSAADVRLATAVADLAAVAILQARALRRAEALAGQLQHALDSRVIIEQAKGVLAERFGLDMGSAFTAIRGYSRSNNTKVAEVATAIVDGDFDTDLLR